MLTATYRNGFAQVRVHYSCDAEKNPATETGRAWFEQAHKGYPSRDWRREMEIDFTVPAGVPVYADIERLIVRPQVYRPSVQLVRGWDFGFSNPVVIFMQVVVENGKETLHILRELHVQNILIEAFARNYVLPETQRYYPGANVVDFGDPAGNQTSDKTPLTSIQVLMTLGIFVRTKFARLEDARKGDGRIDLFQRLISNSQVEIDPKTCPGLLADLRGGYYRDETGRPVKDGIHDHRPDASGYAVWNLFNLFDGQGGGEVVRVEHQWRGSSHGPVPLASWEKRCSMPFEPQSDEGDTVVRQTGVWRGGARIAGHYSDDEQWRPC